MFNKVSEISTQRAVWKLTLVSNLRPINELLKNMDAHIVNVYEMIKIKIRTCGKLDDCNNYYHLHLDLLSEGVIGLNRTRHVTGESYLGYKDLLRHRRAVLPFIGDAMSFLFGTTSEEDLKDIREGIRTLSANQMKIKHVLKRSLTIMDISRADIKQNRKAIKILIGKTGEMVKSIIKSIINPL